MGRFWNWSAGLCLAPLMVAGLALAESKVPNKLAVTTVEEKPSCGQHGTTIDFLDSPKDAAVQARKEGKLVFVLHVSGNFEDPRFT